jgi:hypothetical protein
LLVVPFNFIIQKKINYEVKLSTNPFLFLSSFGFAQGFDVGGVVKETGSGLPIPGVNIKLKNTTINRNRFRRSFSLGVSSGATLVFTT